MDLSPETIAKLIEMGTQYGLQFITALVILFAGFYVAGKVKCWSEAGMQKAKMDLTLAKFLSSMAKYAVLGFTLIAVLAQFGIQTASLIAVLGAAGLAVGLAMQGTLSHIASGVMILIFRPFKVGDYIDGAGESGTIDEIGLFNTIMNTIDNVKIIIPNSRLWDGSIRNYSANAQRRMDLTIGISYDDDIDKALKILDKLSGADERVLSKPEKQILVTNLGESSVDLTMRLWTKKGDFWGLRFDMMKNVKQAFDKEGITIPFPQRALHVVTGEAPEATATAPKKTKTSKASAKKQAA